MKPAKILPFAVLATSLAVLASVTYAVDGSVVEGRFRAADKDGDGKLTREEAKAGMPRVARGFDKLDADKKGYLTLEQVQAAAAH